MCLSKWVRVIYRTNVNQYVAQGNAIGVVTAQLIPSELLPGIFEPISVYWGIALLLTGVGIINQKVSKYLATLTENEVCDTAVDTKTANDTVIVDEIGAEFVKIVVAFFNFIFGYDYTVSIS